MNRLVFVSLFTSLFCAVFTVPAVPAVPAAQTAPAVPVRSTICALTPVSLVCEGQAEPLAVDVPKPAFAWKFAAPKKARNLHQSSYEIRVENAAGDALWQSGKVASAQNVGIIYAGAPLQAFTRYSWRVRVWDGAGTASAWSKPAFFETAFLSQTDWMALWIGDGSKPPAKESELYKDEPAPIFSKTFQLTKKVSSARLYIAGLGYYEASLNSAKIGDSFLDAGWTSYDKQILYASHKITNFRAGENTLSVTLGNGWFNPLPLRMWGSKNIRRALATGRPMLRCELHISYADGSREKIISDETWNVRESPIIRNSVYLGEHYDARRETAAGSEKSVVKNAVKVTPPTGVLTAQIQPPVRVIKTLKPVSITKTKEGDFLVDFGVNSAGVARLKNVRGKRGEKIRLIYGEDKYKNGQINVMTAVAGQIKRAGMGGPGAPAIAIQEDSYTCKGTGNESWTPCFTFHGFRYVLIAGWTGKTPPAAENIEALVLSSDVESTGSFKSSNELFNKLLEVTQRTFQSNLFSVQSDCPAREKFGYGGDLFCTGEAFSYNFDMANFYRKSLRDLINDQRPSGAFTETAPFVGIADFGVGGAGAGPLGWQVAAPFLARHLYEFYGDSRPIETYYPQLKKQVEMLRKTAKENLHNSGLSDHESLEQKPVRLTASVWYLYHVEQLAFFAKLLGKKEDAKEHEKLAGVIRAAIKKELFNPATGQFLNGTQSAQVFGLWSRVLDDDAPAKNKALECLKAAYKKRGDHVATGIFGTKLFFDVMRENDSNALAYTVANRRDFPSWGNMLAGGATTLWETWKYSDNTFSQNHPMFGSVAEWFFRSLLGINPATPGFSKIIIRPQPAGDLTAAAGTFRSVHGDITSDWKIQKTQFNLRTVIPPNTTAEIWLPTRTVGGTTESGKLVRSGTTGGDAATTGVLQIRRVGRHQVITVGSGEYRFSCRYDK